jgi:TPR repeat protein
MCKAATAGHVDAMTYLADMLHNQGKEGEAEQWWRKAAAAGNAGAMSSLGRLLYKQGKRGEGKQWMRKAAGEVL